MATSSTSGSTAASAVTTSNLDVAGIVAQLMTVENQPMEALKAKVTAVQAKISDLGTIKSKLATLQSALTTFEDPSTYNNPSASSSNNSVVTATASSNTAIGSVDVSVAQLATSSKLILTKSASQNYSSAIDVVSIDAVNGFSIKIGNATFNTMGAGNPLISTGANGATTLTDLKNWINGLGSNVQANIVQTISSSDFVLQITGTQTGADNSVLVGLGTITSATATGLSGLTNATIGSYIPASDKITSNGLGTGAIITINVTGANAGSVTVAGGSGYKVGDTVTVAAGALGVGSSSSTFKISAIMGSSSVSSVTGAQDAIATIGGVTVSRSSNKINDVVNGITFNLIGQSLGVPATVTVQQGADNSSAMITTLIKAYNDVITQYNAFTANSNSGSSVTKDGNFATDPSALSFVSNIKSMFAYGATDTTSATISGFGSVSTSANLDVINGYLRINGAKYNFSSIGVSEPTVSQFMAWVNGLNAGITASFDGSNVQLNNSQTGGTNTIDLFGINNAVKRTTISLATMGMDIQLDGTILFNTASFQKASVNNLFGKLSKGLKMGFSGAGSSLSAFLTSELDPTKGVLIQQIASQQTSINNIQKKQNDLQSHLNQVQKNYVSQYSALNALLFQLNSTSTSLASALAAVTNINAGK